MKHKDTPLHPVAGEQRFRSFFEFNPLMCFIVNADGMVRDVNVLGAEELGYSKEELIGHSVLTVFHPEDRQKVLKHVADCLRESDQMHSWELRKIRKNGDMIWVREVGRAIEEADGSPMILITCENITAQRQIENEMESSKANLSAVIENTKDVIWSVDREYRILTMNTQFGKLFYLAYRIRLATGMNILEQVPPDLRSLWEGFYRRVFRGEHFTIEQHYEFSGIILDTEISFNPIVAHDGSITGAAVFSRNITETKKRETAMREIEERYRQMFDKNQAVKWLIDPETGAIVDANSAATEFYGYSLEKLKTMKVSDINTLPVEEIRKKMVDAQAGYGAFHFTHRLANGELRDVELHTGPIVVKGKRLLFSIIQDITERKKAEERIKQYNTQIQSIMESTQDIVFALDTKFRYVAFNSNHKKAMKGIYGLDIEIGKNILDYMRVHDDEKKAEADIQRALRGEQFIIEQEYGNKEINRTYFEASYSPMRNEHGEVSGVTVFVKDITERKNAEKALRESEEKYRSIFENIAEGIYHATEDGQFLTINPSLVKMLGYASAAEVMKLNLNRDVYADPEDRIALNYETRMKGKSYFVEVDWKKKDGTIFRARLNDRAVVDPQGQFQYYEVTVEDVSEQRKLEEHLIQSQKIESIGRIAGGVAHDMNNMLAVILPTAEMMKNLSYDSELVKKYSEVISSSARRAADIVKQLLVFSRKSPSQLSPMDLNELIKETQKMLEHVIGKNIQIQTRLEEDIPPIEADTTQLQQVLMNLSVNARDAMSGSGTLLISTRQVWLDGKSIRFIENIVPGRYIELKVADTGSGIPDEIISRIFDAFFSTKRAGHGTGLGLAVVKSIVLKHLGYIDVISQIGQGTTFTIYLPISESYAPTTVLPDSAESQRGNESILIVDDEEEILKVGKKIFGDLGYVIRTAENGLKAIEMYRQDKADLVLLDIQMPGIDGRETLHRLQAIDPNVKALYITGYARPELLSAIEQSKEAEIIQKPFSIQEMAGAIRKALQN